MYELLRIGKPCQQISSEIKIYKFKRENQWRMQSNAVKMSAKKVPRTKNLSERFLVSCASGSKNMMLPNKIAVYFQNKTASGTIRQILNYSATLKYMKMNVKSISTKSPKKQATTKRMKNAIQ